MHLSIPVLINYRIQGEKSQHRKNKSWKSTKDKVLHRINWIGLRKGGLGMSEKKEEQQQNKPRITLDCRYCVKTQEEVDELLHNIAQVYIRAFTKVQQK